MRQPVLPQWSVPLAELIRYFNCHSLVNPVTTAYFHQTTTHLLLTLENMMPKKSVRRSLEKKTNVPFIFVDLRLSQSERGEFEIWASEHESELATLIEETVQNGYKLSVSYDLNNDCMIASCTCVDDVDGNYNACVTSRHEEALQALLMTFYKVYILLAGKSWRDNEVKSNWG